MTRYLMRISAMRSLLERLNAQFSVRMTSRHLVFLQLLSFAGPCTYTDLFNATGSKRQHILSRMFYLLQVKYIEYGKPTKLGADRYYLTPAGIEYLLAIERALQHYQPPNAWRTVRTKNRRRY